MRRPTCVGLLLFCVVFLSACGVDMMKGKEAAEKVAETQFRERMANGWTGTRKFYSDVFIKNAGEKKWSNFQNAVTNAMGKLKTFSLVSWRLQSGVQVNGVSGTGVLLVYNTSYEKGSGTETLSLYKPKGGNTFAIVGHNVNSPLIQKLIDKGIEQAASGDDGTPD